MEKRMPVLVVIAACVMMATGCGPKQVNKDWSATGGSRSDATVRMSYQYNPQRERPIIDDYQALTLANQRCASWGYTNAEAFGGTTSKCQQMQFVPYVGMVCSDMFVTKEFQCIGRGDDATPDEKKSAPVKKK